MYRQAVIVLCTKPAVLSLFPAATRLKTDVHKRDILAWNYQNFNGIKTNKLKWNTTKIVIHTVYACYNNTKMGLPLCRVSSVAIRCFDCT
jgi:hypothetical protein